MIIAILGAESTGKTQLACALAQRLQAACVGEVLREWCEREGRTPRADEQHAIAAEQRSRIEAAAGSNEIVVADTTPLMTAVYSELLFGDRSLHARALAWHAANVGMTLLMGLDVDWQPDGLQRDGAHVRTPVDRALRDALASHALPYCVIYGRGELRTEAALAAVRNVLPSTPPVSAEGAPFRPRCLECLDPACEQLLHRKA
jgi:nicotinamide riboside kinase